MEIPVKVTAEITIGGHSFEIGAYGEISDINTEIEKELYGRIAAVSLLEQILKRAEEELLPPHLKSIIQAAQAIEN